MRPFRLSLVVLCAGAIALLVPGLAWAPQFIAGPSVRVTQNTQVEFKWTTDVSWYGKIEVFADPQGAGAALVTKEDLDGGLNRIASSAHTISVPVGPVLAADTTYYVRATTSDPSQLNADFANPIPVPFFTGTQALSNVQVTPGTTSADISWQANVVGYGKVEYGTSTSYDHTSTDTADTAGHSFTLTGLDPGVTYYYRLSNVHAIDGDGLASITGSFVTVSTAITGQFLQPLDQSSDPASPILNKGKNGRVILVKVRLSQGGTTLTSQNAPGPVTIAVSKLPACSTIAGADPVESYADAGQSSAGTDRFHYDSATEAWAYGLDTKALGLVTGNCYRIDVSVNGTGVTNAFAVFQPTK